MASPDTSAELEALVTSIWRDVLRIEQIDLDDNFFQLGGDSLGALRITNRLTDRLEYRIPVTRIFEWPTIRQFARGLTNGETPASPACQSALTGRSDVHAPLSFSLYFFSADGSTTGDDKYRLLRECSRFADANGFTAVWLPERHFNAFGGLYPNPSVLGAAIAATTTNIQIRAGSVVIPLQDPLRVAEEWSVVDNLSHGRVGMACASGWHVNDFVLAPDTFADRRQIMLERIDIIRRLWRGESITRRNGSGQDIAVRILPRPIQANLPIWLAAHSDETFLSAARIGANVVTNIWKSDLSQLARQVALYRLAWNEHQGPGTQGIVTLMIHTLIGESDAQATAEVNSAYGEYSSNFLRLREDQAQGSQEEFNLSDDDRAGLIAHATRQLVESRGLVGSPERCRATLQEIGRCGVDEVACLIDFGVDDNSVMNSLRRLAMLISGSGRFTT